MKIHVMGGEKTGKTSIVTQMADEAVETKFLPRRHDILHKTIRSSLGKEIDTEIIDTCGGLDYVESKGRNADGFIVCFSLSNGYTLDDLEKCIKSAKKHQNGDNFVCVVCGNKSDICDSPELQLNERLNSIVSKYGAKFTKTSAFDKESVENAFRLVVDMAIEKNSV